MSDRGHCLAQALCDTLTTILPEVCRVKRSLLTGMSTGIYSNPNLCYNSLTQVIANTWLTEDVLRRNTDTLDKEKKADVTKKYQKHVGDTGSTEVQVALLTDRINRLTGHMRDNRHDYHTQRGLLKLVGRRRRLLSYLSREDIGRYRKLIKGLGLRK